MHYFCLSSNGAKFKPSFVEVDKNGQANETVSHRSHGQQGDPCESHFFISRKSSRKKKRQQSFFRRLITSTHTYVGVLGSYTGLILLSVPLFVSYHKYNFAMKLTSFRSRKKKQIVPVVWRGGGLCVICLSVCLSVCRSVCRSACPPLSASEHVKRFLFLHAIRCRVPLRLC